MRKLILIIAIGLLAFIDVSKEKEATASFYSNVFEGRRTASGVVFKQSKYTCATNLYPLGTILKVTNLKNDSSIEVIVNDRIAKHLKNRIALSKAAFKEIGEIKKGLLNVKIEII